MDSQYIKGPKVYQKHYHMSTEGLVWIGEKGNCTSFSHTLGTHVEAIDPNDLWNSIQTRNKVHTSNPSK